MGPQGEYPRVLVLNGAAFGDHSATAVTLTNLFRSWPKDCLALAHFDEGANDPGGGICSRLWRLSLADVPVDRTVRKLLGRHKDRFLGRAASGMPSGLGSGGGGQSISWRGRLHGVANAWADLLPFRPPPAFETWVDELQPEVIYSMLSNIRLLGLVGREAQRGRIPIVPHFMDDWPTTIYRGWLKKIPREVMLMKLRSVLQRSPVGMSIGPAMAAEYEQRYGRPFRPFMNCVDVPEDCATRAETNRSHPLRLMFFGGLHLNRWRSLESIGQALLVLREEGHAVELVIHTSKKDMAKYGLKLSANPLLSLRETLPLDRLKIEIEEADVLVHVDSFDPDARRYLRLSMSTKLPLCMASGKPLLAYGPGEQAAFRYIQDSGFGVVVGQQTSRLLIEALRLLVNNPDRRVELGQRAWKVAKENHCGKVVRERFRAFMFEVASPSRAGTEA